MSEIEKSGCLALILEFFNLSPKSTKSGIDYSIYAKRGSIFTKNELAFYQALMEAMGNKYVILAKVRLSDVFIVRSRENYQSYLNRINSKHLDFLVCDPKTYQPAFGIELDDRSHQKATRRKRDEFVDNLFHHAKLPLFRVPTKMTYSSDYVKRHLLPGKLEDKLP